MPPLISSPLPPCRSFNVSRAEGWVNVYNSRALTPDPIAGVGMRRRLLQATADAVQVTDVSNSSSSANVTASPPPPPDNSTTVSNATYPYPMTLMSDGSDYTTMAEKEAVLLQTANTFWNNQGTEVLTLTYMPFFYCKGFDRFAHFFQLFETPYHWGDIQDFGVCWIVPLSETKFNSQWAPWNFYPHADRCYLKFECFLQASLEARAPARPQRTTSIPFSLYWSVLPRPVFLFFFFPPLKRGATGIWPAASVGTGISHFIPSLP